MIKLNEENDTNNNVRVKVNVVHDFRFVFSSFT